MLSCPFFWLAWIFVPSTALQRGAFDEVKFRNRANYKDRAKFLRVTMNFEVQKRIIIFYSMFITRQYQFYRRGFEMYLNAHNFGRSYSSLTSSAHGIRVTLDALNVAMRIEV